MAACTAAAEGYIAEFLAIETPEESKDRAVDLLHGVVALFEKCSSI